MDVEAPWDNRKIILEKKFLALPIILRSKPFWCLGVGYSNHTNIKEQLNLKLNLKLKIDAHGKKELNSNPDDALDHFLSAKRLHTRPSSCSTRARLVAPCNYNSNSQIKDLRPNATGTWALQPIPYIGVFLVFVSILNFFSSCSPSVVHWGVDQHGVIKPQRGPHRLVVPLDRRN